MAVTLGYIGLTMSEYAETYDYLYANGYPIGPCNEVWRWASGRLKWHNRRIIDVGCGRGALASSIGQDAEYLGIDASEVATKGKDTCYQFDATKKSILDSFGDFDLALCIDMLEHLTKDDLDEVIPKIVAASSVQVFSISCRPSNYKDANGDGLHLTVEDFGWWIDKISEYTTIQITETRDKELWLVCGSKDLIQDAPAPSPVPQSVCGQKVRILLDSTFSIPRTHGPAEMLLDKTFKRVGKLRWAIPIYERDELVIGDRVAIIGKGPSLDKLTANDLVEYDTIICINDSWTCLPELNGDERLIICQVDPGFGLKNCVAPMIVSQNNIAEFRDSPHDIHCRSTHVDGQISACIAIAVCKEYGCKSIDLYAFDASVSGVTGYATGIGYTPDGPGSPSRFLRHKAQILKSLGSLPHRFH